jgi:hypothetical protein
LFESLKKFPHNVRCKYGYSKDKRSKQLQGEFAPKCHGNSTFWGKQLDIQVLKNGNNSAGSRMNVPTLREYTESTERNVLGHLVVILGNNAAV